MKRSLPIVVLAVVGLGFPASLAADDPEDILVIVNKGTNVKSLSISEVRNIFLGDQVEWRTGKKTVPVHSKDMFLRDAFARLVLNQKGIVDEKKYWQKQKIMHGNIEPPAFSNNLKAVFKLRGSISYVYRSQYLEGVVQVVLVVPNKSD